MRILSLGLIGVLVAAFVATAAAPHTIPRKPFANRTPDQLDFLYNASDRPVLIRIHLRAGDKPYSAIWEAYTDKLFAWVDKDSNGELSPTEAVRVIPSQLLGNFIQGGIGGGGNQTVPFASLDTNKDGKVSKDEFRAYYRREGSFRPLSFFTNNAQAQTAKQVNDAIYRKLGREPKGKLTKADAAKLSGLLAKLDENEDEYLTTTEVNSESGNSDLYGEVQVVGRPARAQAMDPTLFQIEPTHSATVLGQVVINYYDKNKDGKLARQEIGFDKATFDRLDVNKDEKIDLKEIEAHFFREPDLVFKAVVGTSGGLKGFLAKTGLFGKQQRAEILNETKLSAELKKKVKRVNADTLLFDLGDARISFQSGEGQQFNRLQGVKQFYLQQFDAIADKDGVVTRSKGNEGDRFIMSLFTYADKNADAKLTKAEFSEWLDLMGEGGNAFVTLQVNDSGRNLFNVLDLNSDRRLSMRELNTAWSRIEPLCKDSKGLVQSDLPRTLQIRLAQGQIFDQPAFVFFGQQPQAQPKAKAGNVPAWFTKMDRNGDGDVSVKEWLGTEEDFEAIDTDKDRLISADEARAFEAKKGKKDKSKK